MGVDRSNAAGVIKINSTAFDEKPFSF